MKSKRYKCPHPGCGICFTRKVNMEDHILQEHPQQHGGGMKKKGEEDSREKWRKDHPEPPKLPETVVVKSLDPDKEESDFRGAKVDGYFFPQTKSQCSYLQVFYRDTKGRLEARLKKVVEGKKASKWNLVLHCKMTMASRYHGEPVESYPYFRHRSPFISTHPEELEEQLHTAFQLVEDALDLYTTSGSGWTLEHLLHVGCSRRATSSECTS